MEIAGYSEDGRIIFIDRHLPRTFRWLVKTVRVEPFLVTHEVVEKALLDELRLHYLHAHQIALPITVAVLLVGLNLMRSLRDDPRRIPWAPLLIAGVLVAMLRASDAISTTTC